MEGRVTEFPAEGFCVDKRVLETFQRDGCFIIRNYYTQEEVNKLKLFINDNKHGLKSLAWNLDDQTKLWMWNQPGNDVTGMLARSEKTVGIIEELMGGEVYHYFAGAQDKAPYCGSDVLGWHQDYAHWYGLGCLFPDLATMYVCLDAGNKHNGCLTVLLGSPRIGRVDHVDMGGVTLADPNRVKLMKDALQVAYLEVQPGDVFIRNCNLLHASVKNETDQRRAELLVTYNKASNNPVFNHHHPQYTPLEKVPHDSLLKCDNFKLVDKEFLSPDSSPEEQQKLLKRIGYH